MAPTLYLSLIHPPFPLPPCLPGNISWKSDGIKLLGVFLGPGDFVRHNWEGLLARVELILLKWKSLLCQLSYQGRVLVINSLVTSTLCYKVLARQPPADIMDNKQKCITRFFWSGKHWLRP